MKKSFLITAGVLLALGNGHAVASGFVWSSLRNIESITTSGGAQVVTLSGAQIVPGSSCVNLFRIPATDPDGADKLEMLNYADANSYSVKVSYLSTSTACEVYLADIEVIEP